MPASRQLKNLAKMLGARIVELREKRSLTQRKCAVESGLAPSYLSSIESGRRLPSLPAIIGIAKGLGVDVKELFPRG